jgi:hypothetical protein
MAELTIYPTMNAEVAVDAGAHTIYTLYGYEAQASPVPKVWVNGVLKTVTTDYTFSNGTSSVKASITFGAPLAVTDVVTCTYKWKHECSFEEDVEVYQFTKESNVRIEKDVNGNNMVTEAKAKTTKFKGILTWPYPAYAFREIMRTVCELKGSTLEVVRASLSTTDVGTISNLYPSNYPDWNEEPGVVGYAKDMSLTLTELGQ